MRASFSFLAAIPLLVFVACSSTAQGTATGDVDNACNDLATLYCAKIATCGSASIARRYADQSTCIARQKDQCVNTATAPQSGRTVQAVKDCGLSFASAACSDVIDGALPAVCLGPAHPGPVAIGGSCAFGTQCASGHCSVPRGADCGTCATDDAQVGDPCPTSCGPLRYCDASTNLCASYGELGAPCDTAGHNCRFGLVCVGDASGATGACATPAAEGAACDTSSATGTPCSLEDNLVCVAKVCAKAPTATTGQACGPTKPISTLCIAGSRCDATGGATGTCEGPIADGAACNTGSNDYCLPNADCVGSATGASVSGVCTVRTGATCH